MSSEILIRSVSFNIAPYSIFHMTEAGVQRQRRCQTDNGGASNNGGAKTDSDNGGANSDSDNGGVKWRLFTASHTKRRRARNTSAFVLPWI